MKIVFMGTPEFAVPTLEILLANGESVAAVFTQPDKPKGRGRQLAFPPVKDVALQHNLPVYQPTTLKDGEAYQILNKLRPDMIVVVAYGKILPPDILNLPKYGCVNVHASLLPKYRGAGPIQWSILNGEQETGVTTMYMAEGLDTGDMILQRSLDILPNETADELHDRLAALGAETLLDTLRLIEEGQAPRRPQEDRLSSYAPMLSKELSNIDFTKTAKEIHNQIRGLSSWPAAHIILNGKRLKIYHAVLSDKKGNAGVLVDNRKFIVGCGDGNCIQFTEVQYEGSRRMSGEEFLRGRPVPADTKLT